MKKQFIITAFALMACTSNLFAIAHDLKAYGMDASVTQVYEKAENRDQLAPVIKTYYDRIQQGNTEISFEDLKSLHEELCNIMYKGSKHQL